MQNTQIISALEDAINRLPDCYEKVILLTMCSNLYAGVSNASIVQIQLPPNAAKQILAELEGMK